MESENEKKKSRQLAAYYRKVKNQKTNAIKIETVTALDDSNRDLRIIYAKNSKYLGEGAYYTIAKRLFDSLHNNLPSGVWKHFTMMIIENDRKFNNYGDLL